MQSNNPWHRRRAWTPRAPEAQYQAAHRCERMAIDCPDVDCSTRAAAGAPHVKPRHAGQDRSPDRRRPERTPTGCPSDVPLCHHAHRFIVRGLLRGAGAHVDGKPIGAGRVAFWHGGKYPAAMKAPPSTPRVGERLVNDRRGHPKEKRPRRGGRGRSRAPTLGWFVRKIKIGATTNYRTQPLPRMRANYRSGIGLG
jgi:hypothetical protein